MSMDVEKLVRDALDEPAPPAPPETAEEHEGGDGGGCGCWRNPLTVLPDGSLVTTGAGTLLVAWFVVGTLAAVWVALSWLWAVLTIPMVLLVLQVSMALAVLGLCSALTVRVVQRIWMGWRGTR